MLLSTFYLSFLSSPSSPPQHLSLDRYHFLLSPFPPPYSSLTSSLIFVSPMISFISPLSLSLIILIILITLLSPFSSPHSFFTSSLTFVSQIQSPILSHSSSLLLCWNTLLYSPPCSFLIPYLLPKIYLLSNNYSAISLLVPSLPLFHNPFHIPFQTSTILFVPFLIPFPTSTILQYPLLLSFFFPSVFFIYFLSNPLL